MMSTHQGLSMILLFLSTVLVYPRWIEEVWCHFSKLAIFSLAFLELDIRRL